MGWGIGFTPDLYLSNMSFHSKRDLEDKIEEVESMITWCRERLLILAAATPPSLVKDEETDNMFYLHSEFTEIMETLEEEMRKLVFLNILKEHVEENPDFNLKGE